MAHRGTGFFDGRGHFHKTPEEATIADLSGILGKIGEGDSLAPGIAQMLLERSPVIERLFGEHDTMLQDYQPIGAGSKVTRLEPRAG